MTTKTQVAVRESRIGELTRSLEDRRRDLWHAVHGKIRDARTDSTNDGEVLDQGESSEVNIQEDIEFALIQMKAETLNKIDIERIGLVRNSAPPMTPAIHELLLQIHGEYREMPGLNLTASQAERLWGLDRITGTFVLATLIERGVLRQTPTGTYLRGPLG